MTPYRKMVGETVDFLKEQPLFNTDLTEGFTPKVGILTGTGLGESAGAVEVRASFAYKEIPHFPVSTVESHPGRLLFGVLGGVPVAVMQGRIHLYEGYTPLEVTFPIRVMRQMGVTTLIISNAAGGFDPAFTPGDIMIISDHINLTGVNPLTGPNDPEWGLRFPDMNQIYHPYLKHLAHAAARHCGIPVQQGVYAGLPGPPLETPAEVRYLKIIGADAVGFSTVQEAIAAVHGGMRVLGLSVITNINDPDRPVPATMEEIVRTAGRTAPKLEHLIQTILERMAADGRHPL